MKKMKKSEKALKIKAINSSNKPQLKLNNFDNNFCKLLIKSNDVSSSCIQKNFILYIVKDFYDLSII